MIPTLIGITLITFLLCQFVPGGPIDQIKFQFAGGMGEAGSFGGSRTSHLGLDDTQMQILNEYYGFDKPIHIRYFNWLGNILRFDMGTSTRHSQPVSKLIGACLPISIYYGILTTLFTYAICIPLGILKAIRHRKATDNITSVLIFIGYAIPGYALGGILLIIFSVKFDWLPLSGFEDPEYANFAFLDKVKDRILHTILPLTSYLIGSFAVMTMLMKNSLMENMSADYVKTALAKGLTRRKTIFVHALRNSLIPIATSFGNIIALILTGSIFIERIFNIHGIGLLTWDALGNRDYPIVLGIILIASILLLIGNLLSDLCVAMVDPRVRFE